MRKFLNLGVGRVRLKHVLAFLIGDWIAGAILQYAARRIEAGRQSTIWDTADRESAE